MSPVQVIVMTWGSRPILFVPNTKDINSTSRSMLRGHPSMTETLREILQSPREILEDFSTGVINRKSETPEALILE